ncbi:hypothetical protein WJX72_010768 [[Myrmecia] bisecta]|uniref:Uncharacterized protein n=1 Tax=[Myrmecia] bisecta TaxID=41462 RepID=A0AAW1PFV1_9CHLO
MSAWDGSDRFSLLLLEEHEYFFRDYNCHFWQSGTVRVAGHLKVCSAALYFVPRDAMEPILRITYRCTSLIDRLAGTKSTSGEDMFRVVASERVEMKMQNRNLPYKRVRDNFEYLFSLVYTSLEDVLPLVQELWAVSRKDDTKAGRETAKQRLADLVREHEENERFNPGWLEEEDEKVVVELVGNCITPLCVQPGRVVLTYCRIYFQPFNVASNTPIQTFQLNKVVSMLPRTHQLANTGLEIFLSGRNSLFLTFRSQAERDRYQHALQAQPDCKLEHMKSRSRWTRDWVHGKVSNFEYLMYLNREAGRSFKDLTQYPVFPWIIADYTSTSLDLTDKATFRDLSKPIGALNPKRLAEFQERFQELRKMCEISGTKLPGAPPPLEYPPFLYGCHYSTPGYVVYYLMRSEPQLMLRLQNGRFDAPDRLFWSLVDTWKSVTSLPTDVKELIPEFYSSDPSFLLNTENVDFGTRTAGAAVGDVELPAWASDAQDFVQKLAEALEAPLVSRRLHKWIDLIFGRKAQGKRAEAANNVFHYLTYDDIALKQLAMEKDPVMREALRVQMMEFGRTPKQLFKRKHPQRKVHFHTGTGCCGVRAQPSFPARPANFIGPRGHGSRNVSAVSRAVMRLTAKQVGIRRDTLAWLEQTARSKEPDNLLLKTHTELFPLIKGHQDLPGLEMESEEERQLLVVRALKALAVAPQNRILILDAGALEPLLELVCSPNALVAGHAAQVLHMLSKEEDARLNSLSAPPLQTLIGLLSDKPDAELQITAVSTLANLARTLPNRSSIAKLGGLAALVGVLGRPQAIINSLESMRLRREAATALAALVEDDQNKLEVREQSGIPVIMSLAASVELDLAISGTRCLAALSMHDRIKASIVECGGLVVLCGSAVSPSAELQKDVAATLANLCSDSTLIGSLIQTPDCLLALSHLAAMPDREVQRHVARAFWHLTGSEEHREAALGGGALASLLRLAQADTKSVQSRTLARQALRRLAEDPQRRALILAEAGLTEAAAEQLLFATGTGLASSASLGSLGSPHSGTDDGSRRSSPSGTPAASPLALTGRCSDSVGSFGGNESRDATQASTSGSQPHHRRVRSAEVDVDVAMGPAFSSPQVGRKPARHHRMASAMPDVGFRPDDPGPHDTGRSTCTTGEQLATAASTSDSADPMPEQDIEAYLADNDAAGQITPRTHLDPSS